MASFKQLDRNNWQVSFYCKDYLGNNKKYKKSGFNTKKEAKEYSDNFIALHTGASDALFSEAFEDFLKYKAKHLKISSIKRNNVTAKRILNYFDKIKLNEINEKMIFKFLDTVSEFKSEVKKSKSLLNAFLKYAKIHFNFNSFEIIYSVPTKAKRKIEIINLEEFQEYIQTIKNEKYYLLFNLMFFTGIRLGEAMALTYDDVNLKEKYIDINKTKQPDNTVTTPKTKSSIRKVSIPNNLVKLFEEYINKSIIKKGFIFPNTPSSAQLFFRQHLPKENFTTHCFRHSHASFLIKMGFPITSISKRLGHQNSQVTLTLYAHFYENGNDEILDFLNSI